ncbi:MAG TPA: hypothetical protein VD788_01735 [Candidatus Polarisedimenticolaceae bacterium]|nr:hypothetical protein [Candidatus Polarisedimenticolaceae bacterium]
MSTEPFRGRLERLAVSPGALTADLVVGRWIVRFEGLADADRDELGHRWGPFLREPAGTEPALRIRVLDAGADAWLGPPRVRGERYRLELEGDRPAGLIVSHNFALDRNVTGGAPWRAGISAPTREPRGRIVENVARLALAELALAAGGFALHAAGVLHAAKAWLYCGPSRSGKSTAVALSVPARSLGDDFAVLAPRAGEWSAAAVPFDGAERVGRAAPRGEFPVAAAWRLYRGDGTRVERPEPRIATASLMACAAFPWLYPDRAADLLDRIDRFAAETGFAHLHFSSGSDLYRELLALTPSGR